LILLPTFLPSAASVEAHDPEVLAVEVQLFLSAEDLLHDRVDVLGALNLDFIVVS
jgi:hypothetical protein